jgi:hypothetical protein
VDVTNELEKVRVPVHLDRPEAALEQVTRALRPPVEAPRVPEGEVLNHARQGDITDLDCQVDMVPHEAVGVDTMIEPRYPVCEQITQPPPIVVVCEDLLPAITTHHDVVERSRRVTSRLPRH